ncbi:TIGR00341 family protein [Emcibacter nanhaiensis]|uniref:TIGR00341 family protein n=1 Tax=Emcibacter nanhaiensis TaxID=1505037 RepID=A0A501PP38_9PROT|nr:TIGR00341 family protein [Emcibacter nanhaiensis]TPD61531.1 TIGR00341 family protein [Emcibacter nanhaiensis]
MAHRIIQIHVREGAGDLFRKTHKIARVVDSWPVGDDGSCLALLVRTQDVQAVTDRLQDIFPKSHINRIIIQPVEAILPQPKDTGPVELPSEDKDQKAKENGKAKKAPKPFAGVSRDELYADISRGAELSNSFMLLVVFSTIVAGIGLIENNVAVVIGAMVIAPLLGPNLALALSTALGDLDLMGRSIRTMVTGFAIALALSICLGYFWTGPLDSQELLSRTEVGFDSIALALVSGAAAVLSLASGISSVLVGVMVAVALLPPGATMGIMIGSGNMEAAQGAALLLAVNIVCVNLAAKLVFFFKGVGPREWYEKQKAKQAMIFYLFFWLISLVVLGFVILERARVAF